MKPHYSEADLLETYYTQPGESMPVMMHLAACTDCAARYEGLDRKLREAGTCNSARHESFWTRQRMSIVQRVSHGAHSGAAGPHWLRVAAATTLFALLGGITAYRIAEPHGSVTPAVRSAATVTASATDSIEPPTVAHDAWQSEELQDFHSVVDWESWVQQSQKGEQL